MSASILGVIAVDVVEGVAEAADAEDKEADAEDDEALDGPVRIDGPAVTEDDEDGAEDEGADGADEGLDGGGAEVLPGFAGAGLDRRAEILAVAAGAEHADLGLEVGHLAG